MPELPEVETIVKDLKPQLKGLKFRKIESSHMKAVKPSFEEYKIIIDKTVLDVQRKGKYINIFFENDYVLTIHLRMSGRLIIKGNKPYKHERHLIIFDELVLSFCDLRKFGTITLFPLEIYLKNTNQDKLGPEPLEKSFDFNNFLQCIKSKKGFVKKILLDQHIIAGIGNIYADEACFYAKIRPNSKIERLSKNKRKDLYEGILKALKQGLKNRGTSISDYSDAFGKIGTNQEKLFVYSRGGKACFNCKNNLIKVKLVGRGTVYCNKCQKLYEDRSVKQIISK